ncbi:unnamed protein product, partial [Ectocarpus fasciculatus]
MATAAAGTGWDCPKCTFRNDDPEATICQVCNQGRRPGGRSNGSRLRPPPKAPSPPLISSFGDYDDDKDASRGAAATAAATAGARTGRSKAKSRQGKKRPGTIQEEEEEEEETAVSSKRPRTNTRSSSRARQQQQRTESALVVEDSEEEHQPDQEVVSVDGGGGDGASDPAAASTDDDGVDDSGETPLLLGRGWSTAQKERAKQRKLDKERGGAGRKSGGGAAVSRQRGKKRQRPLPSYPGDDIFRNRTYAVVEGRRGHDHDADDDDDRPLVLRRAVTGDGTRRPAWRWPPTPTAKSMACEDGGGSAMSPGSRCAVRRDRGGDKAASNSG